MTKEDKELLLKDLCARLPYGVKCIEKTPIEDFQDKNLWEIDRIRADTFMFGMSNCYVCYGQYDDIHNIKPYLFPLSSITKEIMDEIYATTGVYDISIDSSVHIEVGTTFIDLTKIFDILHKHHIDYRGLIPKGLAIDATGLNVY